MFIRMRASALALALFNLSLTHAFADKYINFNSAKTDGHSLAGAAPGEYPLGADISIKSSFSDTYEFTILSGHYLTDVSITNSDGKIASFAIFLTGGDSPVTDSKLTKGSKSRSIRLGVKKLLGPGTYDIVVVGYNGSGAMLKYNGSLKLAAEAQ